MEYTVIVLKPGFRHLLREIIKACQNATLTPDTNKMRRVKFVPGMVESFWPGANGRIGWIVENYCNGESVVVVASGNGAIEHFKSLQDVRVSDTEGMRWSEVIEVSQSPEEAQHQHDFIFGRAA